MIRDRRLRLANLLLPTRGDRQVATGFVLCGLIIFGVLSWYVRDVRATRLDLLVDGLFRLRPMWIDSILSPATEMLGPLRVVAAGFVFSVLCFVVGEVRAAALSIVGPPAALLITELWLKPVLDRPPVSGQGDAFPSGHATAAFALSIVVSLLLRRQGAVGRHLATVPRVLGLVLAVLVPIYLSGALALFRHHYITDILGGLAVGGSVVLMVAIAFDLLGIDEPDC